MASALRLYCIAQAIYQIQNYSALPDNGGGEGTEHRFAPTWRSLGGALAQLDAQGNRLELIPAEMADAMESGKRFLQYYFADVREDARGKPLDRTKTHALCAVPDPYLPGALTYLADPDGVLFAKDTEGRPVTGLPARPKEEGWVKIQQVK